MSVSSNQRVLLLLLALALASLGVAFMHFGLVTQAQTTSCSYKTHVKVYEDTLGGPLVRVDEQGDLKWIAVNNRGQKAPLDTEGLSQGLLSITNMLLKPQAGAYYKPGEEAFVVLTHFDEKEWTIKEVYCKENPGSTPACPSDEEITQENLNPKDTIEGFHVNCGVDLEYGWVISSNKPHPTVTPPKTGNGQLTIDLLVANKPQDIHAWSGDDPANKPVESCTATSPERPHFYSVFKLRADCVSDEPDCQAYDPKHEKDITVDKRKGSLTFPNLPAGTYAINVKGIQERGFSVASACRKQTFTVHADDATSGVIVLENFTDGNYETTGTEGQCTSQGNKKAVLVERVSGALCFSCSGKDCKGNETSTPTQPTGGPTNVPTTPNPPKESVGNELDQIVQQAQTQCGIDGGKNNINKACPYTKLEGKVNQKVYGIMKQEISAGYNPLQCVGLVKGIGEYLGTPMRLRGGPAVAGSYGNPTYAPDTMTVIPNPCWKKRVGSPEFNTCLGTVTDGIKKGDYAVWDDEINNVTTGKSEIVNHIAFVLDVYDGGTGRFKVIEANYGGPGWVRFNSDKVVHDRSLKAWLRPKGTSSFDLFSTPIRATIDTPKVLQTIPQNKSTYVNLDTDVSFVFNRPVQANEVKLFSIPPLSFKKTINGAIVTFSHEEEFPKNSQVILKLTYPQTNDPAEPYIEFYTGAIASKKVDTRPRELEKQDAQTSLREAPDVFVKNRLTQRSGVYRFTTPFVRTTPAHYQFSVNLEGQDPRTTKGEFEKDVLSLGLSDGQLSKLDIKYYPDVTHTDWALVCDINNDKICNTLDYARCIRSYGAKGENVCDMNLSGEINAIDISLIVKHLNE